MAPNPRRQDEKLQAIYDRIPAMKNCRGLCADSCGPIECSVREAQKMERESGRKLEAPCGTCSMLTPLGRCSVYELRPVICRIFGTTRALRCQHGCEPEFWLDDTEGLAMIRDSLMIGGAPAGWQGADLTSLTDSRLGMAAQLAVALRVVRSLGQPLGDAVASIEGTTAAEASLRAGEGDS